MNGKFAIISLQKIVPKMLGNNEALFGAVLCKSVLNWLAVAG